MKLILGSDSFDQKGHWDFLDNDLESLHEKLWIKGNQILNKGKGTKQNCDGWLTEYSVDSTEYCTPLRIVTPANTHLTLFNILRLII